MSIYDRQHLNADSPYRFPEHLARFVRGGLDYSEMVRAYKAHPVHVNVNSVDGSPTMFSRRVMEIAASGAAVISGTGLGVEQIMNGLVPVVANPAEADLLVQEWMTNEQARNRDAWLAYRHVYRGHTAAHRLAYVLRTAGLQVQSPEPPAYAVFIESLTPEVVSVLKVQTIQPARIYCVAAIDTELPVIIVNDREDAKRRAKAEGIPYVGEPGDGHGDRTVFEDMLTATSFGSWSSISISGDGVAQPGLGLAEFGTPLAGSPQLGAVEKGEHPDELRLRRELIQPPVTRKATTANGRKTVLIAGHDLKFAGGAMSQLEALGHRVIVDKWDDHNKHNEAESRSLLIEADVIFCEWTLGNAVWYSRNKLPHQRLVSRLHLQEIFRPFVKEVDYHQVDEMIFVGQHILEVAVRDHNVPRAYSRVIPNAVDIEGLHKEKHPDARFNLGLVGIVPARKRLDMALEVLRMLRKHDDRYRLFIKGKRPEDFPGWPTGRRRWRITRSSIRQFPPILCLRAPSFSMGKVTTWRSGIARSASSFQSATSNRSI
ncbi:glycosyltransferase family protein [Arthrobacter sp. SA17]